MRKLGIVLMLGLACAFQAQAQETWSLQKCVDHALTHNISIKQYEVNNEYQQNQLQQAKNNRLPGVDANISQGLNFGRSQQSEGIYRSADNTNMNMQLGASAVLYSGNRIKNNIAYQDIQLQKSLENLQKAKNDVALNVASSYLEILYAKEVLLVSEKQVQQTKQQKERTKLLVDAGTLAAGVLLEIEAQLAREELAIVNNQNSLQLALLNMAQYLELEKYDNFDIETPALPEIQAQSSLAQSYGIYEKAVLTRPEIKSAEFQLKSEEVQLKIAKSDLYPTLSASAGISDSYFNSFNTTEDPFFKQLRYKHGESVGLNLRIPIFNKFQTKTNIANAQLQIDNSQLELERAKKELRKQIEQVQTSAVAAHKRFLANRTAVKSMQESFRYVEEKFNAGRVNSVEYNDAKTKLAVAESELIQAKYEFIFRTKILDFYNGIPIAL